MAEQYQPATFTFPEDDIAPPHSGGDEGAKQSKDFGDIVRASRRILLEAKNVFPFDLFTDKIIIDENKVDIIYGIFFYSKEVFSIPYNRISQATSTIGLFFGSITLEIQGYEQNPSVLKWLWRSDAIRARRMINGLVTAHQQGIDLTKLDLTGVKHLVEEIGTADGSR